MKHIPASILLAGLVTASFLSADTFPDSTAVPADSAVTVDTIAAAADTAARKTAGKPVMKDSVLYQADTIIFEMETDRVSLYGNALVRYQGVELTAHQIHLDTETRTVDASGILRADSADTQWTGTPVLVEKSDRVEGFKMTYNLESRKGRIDMGTTEFENGHFAGPQVAIVDDKTLNARNGRFSTCDEHDDPHYHFASKRMKLYVNDKIIIKPVILKINKVPVMALPFFIFPVKKERHSGFLIPRYGTSSDYGRYLKNVGYYWAPNDYFDARSSMEFYTESRTQVNGRLRFARRYLLSGSISGSYIRTGTGNTADRNWKTRYTYNHNLPAGWTLSGSGTFSSDRNYFEEYEESVAERSTRRLYSSLTLNKRWRSSSLNISATQDQTFLDSSTVTAITLPSASFSTSGNLLSGLADRRSGTGKEDPWYTRIRYSYRSGFTNSQNKTTAVTADTGTFSNTVSGNQYAQLRYTENILSWLSASPQVSYSENCTWWEKSDSSYQTGAYKPSVSLTAQQDIFGLFPVNRAGIEAFRHVIHPSAAYSYSYTQTFRRYAQSYLPFTPSDESGIGRGSSVSLGLTNLWQCKLNRSGTEQKISLLTGPNFSSGYDFFTEKFSSIRTHLHTSIKMVNLNLDFTHSLYEEDGETLLMEHPDAARRRFARETDRTFSLSTHFNQSRQFRYPDDIRRYTILDAPLEEQVLATVTRPFSARINYSISFRKGVDKPTQNLYGGFSANLTRNWKADYSGTYDVENTKFLSQTITILRDMHCWEARLAWHPTGYNKNLDLRIYIKDLPEVKVEKSVHYD